MKKVIIVINNLETGGVQTSLLNLIKEIHNIYDVTVLTFFYKAEYKCLIPKNVKLITLNSPFKHFGMSRKDTIGKPVLFMSRAFWVIITKLFGRTFTIKIMSLFQSKLNGYDYAISYLHEGTPKSFYGGCNEFVLRKVDAKKKVGWLHCDFSLCGANNPRSKKIYQEFDTIIACSEGSKRSFLKCMPGFADKCVSVRNCNDYRSIKKLAGDGIKYDSGFFNIITVARLAEEKGIERAIKAIKCCLDKGYKVMYHIVGSGDQEAKLKSLIAKLGIENYIVFYGNQQNPYPYMISADLFILPSYHEAAPIVFDEAACLGVPVLATETISTDEMIIESGHGLVCENSQEGIKQSLEMILTHSEMLCAVREKLSDKNFNNEAPIQALQKIIY